MKVSHILPSHPTVSLLTRALVLTLKASVVLALVVTIAIAFTSQLKFSGRSYLFLDSFSRIRDVIRHVPEATNEFDEYSFGHRAFDRRLRLDRTRELEIEQLITSIQSGLPKGLRRKFQLIIDRTLHFSAQYKVDPFWVLSVMWTESHFNPTARSPKDAMGLMQIMPATGEYLHKKLKRPIEDIEIVDVISDPETNIELGVYYLKRLHKMFYGNFKLATIAYNMDPYWVKSELRKGHTVGGKNKYLDKVRDAYKQLTANYLAYTKRTPEPYKSTIVYLNPKRVPVNLVSEVMKMLKPVKRPTEIALIADDNPFAYSVIL